MRKKEKRRRQGRRRRRIVEKGGQRARGKMEKRKKKFLVTLVRHDRKRECMRESLSGKSRYFPGFSLRFFFLNCAASTCA